MEMTTQAGILANELILDSFDPTFAQLVAWIESLPNDQLERIDERLQQAFKNFRERREIRGEIDRLRQQIAHEQFKLDRPEEYRRMMQERAREVMDQKADRLRKDYGGSVAITKEMLDKMVPYALPSGSPDKTMKFRRFTTYGDPDAPESRADSVAPKLDEDR